MPTYLKMWFIFVMPCVMIFGILGNILIIMVISSKCVGISKTLKIYYVSIAVSDLINIIFCNLLWSFLVDSLYLLTEGKFYIPLVHWNDISCKTIQTIWILSELYSNYAAIAMGIERLLCLFCPISGVRVFSVKFTLVLLTLCVLPAWISVVPVGVFVIAITYEPGASATQFHCSMDTGHQFAPYFVWAFDLSMNMLHEILNGVIVVALLAGLAHAVSTVKQLTQHASSRAFKRKAIDSAMTILAVAAVKLLIYLPIFFSLMSYYILDWTHSITSSFILANIYRMSIELIIFAHSLNVVIYFVRIRSYRKRVCLLLTRASCNIWSIQAG